MKTKIAKQKIFVVFLFGFFILTLSACTNNFKKNQAINENQNPPVKPGQVAMIGDMITINQPLNNQISISPLLVTGQTSIDTDKIYFRMVDFWNNVLATSSAAVNKPNNNFETSITFLPPFGQQGAIEAYTLSGDKKSEMNLIKIPIEYKEFRKPVVNVYFSNINKDPELKNCQQVYPLERLVAFTPQLVSNAINELLKGVTESEMKAGYLSNIPETGVKINKMEYKDGVIAIDFNEAMKKDIKNKCQVTALRAQFLETLKQFGPIKDLVMTIDGKDDKILKP